MKKIIIYLLLIFTATLSIYSPSVYAWDDCPKGEVDDPYPGECSQYIDTDNNGICDHSEPAPEDRVAASTNATKSSESTYTAVPIIENTVTEDNSSPSKTDSNITATNASTKNTQNEKSSKYNFWLISSILIVIYIISFTLSKTNTISTQTHRKFWNIILLATFLVSGVTGLLLTIRIDNPTLITLPQNFLFLHVEFGVVMALISIFHIIWHWPYYKCMLRSKNNNQPSNNCPEKEDNTLK